MRIVCYIVRLNTMVPGQPPTAEQIIYYGAEEEVLKDLENDEKTFGQALITHAADPLVSAVLQCKLQITRQLKQHDVDVLPRHPVFGTGEVTMQSPDRVVTFRVHIQVSSRGELTPEQKAALPDDLSVPRNVLIAGS